ncbi:DNA sulfur modification protein DndD [Enterobacter hormaechei]|uniref:DNA sulfur modification protein DndD n=1 Tax=Enterobacter hormaechei TaxID=158836 RepID=UPI0007935E6E|nr:DNA sulfur modification protein DndD [Enterobacter hormaechei]HCM9744460.1 DNA sulfur modification protein DndD [Enterobacter hormaechei subsp. steigerwaltii]HCM9747082.1 DNA sulfur modification protein DndD [Enterobacter hormaechei subsp. steigerwaltii]
MIFNKLRIMNFGIYQGEHLIDLEVERDKPIILLGALNGGGKTTFLDAIQLVLYGKHARCSNRAGTAYGAFLSSCKNRFSSPEAEVKLSLTFTHRTEDRVNRYDIERSWYVKGSDTKDKIKVYVDLQPNEHLSQHWDEFVNEFIPLSLSDLFFFDGEKIENLAHPQRSSELVRTGIESLLGLDLLSQLQIDLAQVDKKRSASNVDQSIIAKVEACENEMGQCNAAISDLKKEIVEIEHGISNITIAVNKARQAVRNAGAHLIEKRDELKFELGTIETKLNLNKVELIKLAAGVGPLGLVKDLINETKMQIHLETKATQAKILDEAINIYNEKILNVLKTTSASEKTINHVNNIIIEQAQEQQALANVECFLKTELGIFNGLEERIYQEDKQRQKLKKEQQLLLEQQALLQQQLDTVPDYESVQHLITELAEREANLKSLTAQYKHKKQLLEQTAAKNNILSQRYTNLLAQQNKDTFEQKRTIQVSSHIKKLKITLQNFAEILIRENIDRLQTLVKQKFDILGRKSQLIRRLEICPESFAITLYDTAGNILEAAKLSAGERQLLAIAILWGLAEASGKELPTVIDTPLSRLDGKHRSKLVNYYFPKAGPQVVLLSTDEEIIGEYYQQLKPYISRELHISHDEKSKTSSFKEGYF